MVLPTRFRFQKPMRITLPLRPWPETHQRCIKLTQSPAHPAFVAEPLANGPIVTRVDFSGCNMPAMVSPGHESESKQVLEAQLRATLEVIPAYTWYALPSGALTFVNKRHADYLGLPKAHPLRLGIDVGAEWDSHLPLLHPDDHAEMRRAWSQCLRTGCPGEVSFRARNAEGGYRWFLSRVEPLLASDGTLLYWIGVTLDIDDAKQAENALRKSEKELRDAIDTIPALVWSALPDGSNTYANKRFVEYLGLSAEHMAGSRWHALIHPDDLERHASKWMEAVATCEPHENESRYRRSDGQYRWHLDRGVPLRDEDGNTVRWYGVTTDIEDRKRAEEALQRSEAYLAEAQRLSHTGSFGWKPDSGEIVWSDETYRIFEYDHAVKPTIDLAVQRVHPDDLPEFLKVIESASAGATQFEHTYRLLRTDGSVKHVHAIAHSLQDVSGNREFVGAVTDITEQRQAEAVIRQQEAELRKVVDTIPALVWSTLPDGSNSYVNKRFVEYTGSSPEQTAGSGWKALIHPDDLERHAAKWMEALAAGKPHENEVRSRRSDGQYRWQLDRGVPLRDEDGNIVKWYGVTTDIEDRKRAEEALRSSEAYLAEAQRLAHMGSWAWSPDQGTRYCSGECYRVLGFDPRDGLPRFEELIQRIHPDDQPGFRELIQTAIRQKAEWQADYRIVHPGGAIRDIHVVGHPVLSTSGHLVEFVGTVIDVTERKRAEEELRRSEMELRQMLDFTPQLVGVFGPNGERLHANRILLDYLGTTLDEWRQTPGNFFSSRSFIHPDDCERAARTYSDNARSGGSAFDLELRVRKGDGSYRWFLARYNAVRDDKGQVMRWYAACTDIEDRKRAEDRLQRENVALREEIDKASMFEEIVGTSPALQAVLSRISKVAPSDSTVLITGETGTGKELVARAIHRRSGRSSRAFVSVNCAAVPRDLIASELFGHEKGAFTGATQQRLGRFELANGGTLFLDEVGELPAETQIALLRVLQEHEFERVGGTRPIRADVRVIAATNRDLQAAISAGSFRSDLFYRLNVFPIEIPSLRERRADIPLLVEYFIDRYARKAGKHITTVEKKTLQVLQSYPWPGNIRELQNVIERSVIVCDTENFSVDESWLSRQPVAEPKSQVELSRKLAAQEKEMIEAALRESGGRVSGPSGAAAKLGIPGSTLDSKIRSLKINKNRFKTADPSTDRT
jgi:PAS domain S-box-containing protein